MLERQAEADAVLVAPWPLRRAEYYGCALVDVSTADSLGARLVRDDAARRRGGGSRALGFGDHVRVEKLQFGRRLSAQPGDGSPDLENAAADERAERAARRAP